jgi:hypothetical protein
MKRAFPLAAVAVAFAASGCTYSSTTQAVANPPLSRAEQVCINYGFTPGTTAYGRCVSGQAEARVTYSAVPTYAEPQVATDARVACSSYGLTAGTVAYDRCLANELNARGYRQETVYQPTASPYAYNPGYSSSYTTVNTAPATGVQVFRDEYGFRYDEQGNRLDRYGNIISPHSTRP